MKNMKKKKKQKILIVSLSIAIVIGIVFIVAGVRRTPEKSVKKYISAINKGNTKKAMKCLNIKKDDTNYDEILEELDDLVDNPADLFITFFDIEVEDDEDVETKAIIDQVEIDGDPDEDELEAKVFYFLISESSEGIKIGYNYKYLYKINGKWLIDIDY